MRWVVLGTRQNAYLDEFYPVVWLKIAPKAANCCPPGSPTIFYFSAVFSAKISDHRIEKNSFNIMALPNPSETTINAPP